MTQPTEKPPIDLAGPSTSPPEPVLVVQVEPGELDPELDEWDQVRRLVPHLVANARVFEKDVPWRIGQVMAAPQPGEDEVLVRFGRVLEHVAVRKLSVWRR